MSTQETIADVAETTTASDAVVPSPKVNALIEKQSEILMTAHDLGLEIPADLKAEITDEKQGKKVIKELDTLIKNHLAESANQEPEKVPDEGVAPEAAEGHTTKKRASKKSVKPEPEVENTEMPNTAKKTKAAKTTAKKPAPKKVAAKKAPPKKTAGTKTTKQIASANARAGVSKFPQDAKINWTHKGDFPAREGTAWHDRLKLIKDAAGKTIASYKGDPGALRAAIAKGFITVK